MPKPAVTSVARSVGDDERPVRLHPGGMQYQSFTVRLGNDDILTGGVVYGTDAIDVYVDVRGGY